MTLITDKALLADSAADDNSTEVFIDTTAKTIKLVKTGDLSDDGVTMKALYSFLKEQWRLDPLSKNLAAFWFPMTPITDESFEFVKGWSLLDATANELIRTSGWTVRDASDNVIAMFAGIIGLGNVEGDDQPYFDQGQGRVDFALQGQVNQAVQILDDPNGDGSYADGFDYRAAFTVFVREQGQVFASANLESIGVTSGMAPIAYRFPLSTGADVKIETSDTGIDSNSDGVADVAPFDSMSITFHDTAQTRDIGGTDYDFGVIIDGASGTKEQIYEYVQWALRQPIDADDDASVLLGDVAPELLEFVGDTLKTKSTDNPDGGGDGVYIDNFLSADQNELVFVDNSDAEQTFPRTATLILQMGANLVNDSQAKYFVFYGDPDGVVDGDEWGVAGAIKLVDSTLADVEGDVNSQGEIQISYDYDGDTTGGRAVGTDVPIVAVAIGFDTGQYVQAQGTITFPSATVALVAPLERNAA